MQFIIKLFNSQSTQRIFSPSPFSTILSSGILGNTSSSCPRKAEEKQDWQAPYLLQHISITRIIHWTSWITLAFQWARGITMTQRCEFQMHAEIIRGYKTPGGRHSLESLVWSECTESYFQTEEEQELILLSSGRLCPNYSKEKLWCPDHFIRKNYSDYVSFVHLSVYLHLITMIFECLIYPVTAGEYFSSHFSATLTSI